MSGYLHGLVARAAGALPPTATTLHARRPLRFPPALAFEPDDGVADRATSPRGAIDTELGPMTRRRRDDTPQAATPGKAREETESGERPVIADTPVPRRPMPHELSPVAPTAPSHDAVPVAVREEITSTTRPPFTAVPPAENPPPPPLTTLARLRPPPPRSPVPAEPSAVPSDPRIEVRIGRVEVRRPVAPEPPRRRNRAAAPSRPAARGFGELASARRYVDRLAH